jgi:MFS family permease
VITALGITQIFAWGSSYYLPAVLVEPISRDSGWSLTWVVGGLSFGLMTAGFVSPLVGRAIARQGGRLVLAVSSMLLAIGLLGLALAHSLPVFLAAWLVIGCGMGAGLYDPAFATLGRLYGQGGRSAITTLTLFGGFASTVCWPLSAFLEAHVGWRGTCLVYAALQLAVALPLYLFMVPREPRPQAIPEVPFPVADMKAVQQNPGRDLFLVLATALTLASMISTVLSVHLLTILQAKGLSLAAAVSLGALVGPAQVAARSIEMLAARHHHPIWTKLLSTALVASGVSALWFGEPLITLALILYGGGIGLESIARGTLPLAIFGPERYPVMMGRIAMPSLFAQAAAPSIGSILLVAGGPGGALAAFTAAALCNLILGVILFLIVRRP